MRDPQPEKKTTRRDVKKQQYRYVTGADIPFLFASILLIVASVESTEMGPVLVVVGLKWYYSIKKTPVVRNVVVGENEYLERGTQVPRSPLHQRDPSPRSRKWTNSSPTTTENSLQLGCRQKLKSVQQKELEEGRGVGTRKR